MKRVRRVVLVVAIIGIVVCIVLLLNFTASNPTHRRYSSRAPLTTGQGASGAIGLSAEQILSKDLGLPRNEDQDQRKCICGASGLNSAGQCNSCITSLPTVDTFRLPDFVSSKFIADAKNQARLHVQSRDFQQLRDFADAAKALDISLWVFVRVDTDVDPELRDMVRAAGGDVVFYFVIPGYEDPTTEAAQRGLLVSVIAGVSAVAPDMPPVRRRFRRVKKDAAVQANAVLDDAERLLAAMKDKARRE